jgi:hypothetical protein
METHQSQEETLVRMEKRKEPICDLPLFAVERLGGESRKDKTPRK